MSTVYDTDDALRGLLAVILNPETDSDHARLVYADRCDELAGTVTCGKCDRGRVYAGQSAYPCRGCNGTGRVSDGLTERAEFIRVQVELAKLKAEFAPPIGDRHNYGECHDAGTRMMDLRRRERGLLAPNWSNWVPDIPHPRACGNRECFPNSGLSAGGRHVVMTYRRGFVEQVTCTAADWERHADAILAAQPVREVRLTTIGLPVWGSLRYRPKAGVIYDRWPFTVILRGTEPELLDVPLGLITQAPFDPSALTDAIRAERERIMGEVIARSLADRAPFVFGDEPTDE